MDSAEGLRKDIEEVLIIKNSMEDLWILVFCTFGKFLVLLLVAAHTLNHTQLSKRKEEPKG